MESGRSELAGWVGRTSGVGMAHIALYGSLGGLGWPCRQRRTGMALLAESRDGPAGRGGSGWPCWQRVGMVLLAEEGRDGCRGWDWEWEH